MEVKFTSDRARGRWSFQDEKNRKRIRALLRAEAERSQIQLRRVSLEGVGTLRIRFETERRENLSRFLRVLAGRIPRVLTGAERGRPLGGGRRFWSGLVSSRCLNR